jgi:hypothetical protein
MVVVDYCGHIGKCQQNESDNDNNNEWVEGRCNAAAASVCHY